MSLLKDQLDVWKYAKDVSQKNYKLKKLKEIQDILFALQVEQITLNNPFLHRTIKKSKFDKGTKNFYEITINTIPDSRTNTLSSVIYVYISVKSVKSRAASIVDTARWLTPIGPGCYWTCSEDHLMLTNLLNASMVTRTFPAKPKARLICLTPSLLAVYIDMGICKCERLFDRCVYIGFGCDWYCGLFRLWRWLWFNSVLSRSLCRFCASSTISIIILVKDTDTTKELEIRFLIFLHNFKTKISDQVSKYVFALFCHNSSTGDSSIFLCLWVRTISPCR